MYAKPTLNELVVIMLSEDERKKELISEIKSKKVYREFPPIPWEELDIEQLQEALDVIEDD